jgi:hypothetical protein
MIDIKLALSCCAALVHAPITHALLSPIEVRLMKPGLPSAAAIDRYPQES